MNKMPPPYVCMTATGFLIEGQKVLLVKHKKLGIWLSPGGHIDRGELPHKAAEREFREETGIKVRAVSAFELIEYKDSKALPLPFSANLHWINRDIYEKRVISKRPSERIATKKWPLGCEQHMAWCFLVRPEAGVDLAQNMKETDGIGWFNEKEIGGIETTEDINGEIERAVEMSVSLARKR